MAPEELYIEEERLRKERETEAAAQVRRQQQHGA